MFYNLGPHGDVSPNKNLKHLKEELLCQLVIQSAITAFTKVANESKVSIYGKKIYSTIFSQSPANKNWEIFKLWICLSSRPVMPVIWKRTMEMPGLSTLSLIQAK